MLIDGLGHRRATSAIAIALLLATLAAGCSGGDAPSAEHRLERATVAAASAEAIVIDVDVTTETTLPGWPSARHTGALAVDLLTGDATYDQIVENQVGTVLLDWSTTVVDGVATTIDNRPDSLGPTINELEPHDAGTVRRARIDGLLHALAARSDEAAFDDAGDVLVPVASTALVDLVGDDTLVAFIQSRDVVLPTGETLVTVTIDGGEISALRYDHSVWWTQLHASWQPHRPADVSVVVVADLSWGRTSEG